MYCRAPAVKYRLPGVSHGRFAPSTYCRLDVVPVRYVCTGTTYTRKTHRRTCAGSVPGAGDSNKTAYIERGGCTHVRMVTNPMVTNQRPRIPRAPEWPGDTAGFRRPGSASQIKNVTRCYFCYHPCLRTPHRFAMGSLNMPGSQVLQMQRAVMDILQVQRGFPSYPHSAGRWHYLQCVPISSLYSIFSHLIFCPVE